MKTAWTTEQAESLRDAVRVYEPGGVHNPCFAVSVGGVFQFLPNFPEYIKDDYVVFEGEDCGHFVSNWFGEDLKNITTDDAMAALTTTWPCGIGQLIEELEQ